MRRQGHAQSPRNEKFHSAGMEVCMTCPFLRHAAALGPNSPLKEKQSRGLGWGWGGQWTWERPEHVPCCAPRPSLCECVADCRVPSAAVRHQSKPAPETAPCRALNEHVSQPAGEEAAEAARRAAHMGVHGKGG